jgi:hypothetical protein
MSWLHDNGAAIYQGWMDYGCKNRQFVYLLVAPGAVDREFILLGEAKAAGAAFVASESLPPRPRPRLIARCTRCKAPRRDKEQEHPGVCVCGGHIFDVPFHQVIEELRSAIRGIANAEASATRMHQCVGAEELLDLLERSERPAYCCSGTRKACDHPQGCSACRQPEPKAGYKPEEPISIFNHPPLASMSLRELEELERSWP